MTTPNTNSPLNQLTDEQAKSLIDSIINEHLKSDELISNSLSIVDETVSKNIASSVTFYYFMLSINAACIGFLISLSVNKKFIFADILLLSSLLFWAISFMLFIIEIHKLNQIIGDFSFFILGKKIKELKSTESHSKSVHDYINEPLIWRKQPITYFGIGLLIFLIWYLVIFFSN